MRQRERAERRDMGRGREWMKEKEVMRVVGRIFVSSKKKNTALSASHGKSSSTWKYEQQNCLLNWEVNHRKRKS